MCPEEKKHGRVLCFLHHTPGDLLLDQHKIVGSAQRKQRGAVMQHGGILLARSQATPELPGIQELTGVTVTPEQLLAALQAEMARSLGWELLPQPWSDQELRRIAELIQSRYGTAEWNRKR